MDSRFKLLLYSICVLTDFSAFVVIFAVSRGLAEGNAEPWYLGAVGAGLSLTAGVGSILGGWLAHRFDGRVVFVAGAAFIGASIAACAVGDPSNVWFLPGYWLLGLGLGCLYPPLVGWLNQGVDPHANRLGVSRTLILYCVAWNVGMMGGQLTAGSLFSFGANWTFGTAFCLSLLNLLLSVVVVRRVVPLAAATVCEMSNHMTLQDHQTEKVAFVFKKLSWIANLGGMFGGSMVIHLLPDLAVDIGVSANDHGMLLASWRAVIIATYGIMHSLTFWQYRIDISLASQGLAAVGLIVIAQSGTTFTLLIGLALLGQLVGYNYFSGLFYSTVGSVPEGRALAAGIHEATLATGMAAGTLVGGALGSLLNHRMPYLLAAVVLLAMMLVQVIAWRRWKKSIDATENSTPKGNRLA